MVIIIAMVIYLVFSQSLAEASHAVDSLVARRVGFLSFIPNICFPLFHNRISLDLCFLLLW